VYSLLLHVSHLNKHIIENSSVQNPNFLLLILLEFSLKRHTNYSEHYAPLNFFGRLFCKLFHFSDQLLGSAFDWINLPL